MSDIDPQGPAAPIEGLPLPQPERGRGPLRLAAVWAGVVAVLAGAVVAVVLARGGGNESPTAAVEHLISAASNADVLGMLDALPPSERDAIQSGVVDMTKELQRLKVLSSTLDLHKVPGLQVSFDNLHFRTTALSDDVTTVEIISGTSHSTVRAKELPIGDFLRSQLGEQINQQPESKTNSSSIKESDPVRMVTLKEDGHWYVSIAYTIAEAARKSSGHAAPTFGHGLAARGAASPEQAVDDLVHGAVTLDVQRLLELLPPDEARALDDYAPLFLADAKRGAADAAKQFHASVDDLALASDKNGDTATVHIKKLALSVAAGDVHVVFRNEGQCTDVNITGVPADAFAEVPQLKGGKGHFCQNDAATKKAIPFLSDLSKFQAGIVTVQRGGSWYISPTRTFFGAIIGVLRTMQPDDLNKAVDFFHQFGSSGESCSASGLSSPGTGSSTITERSCQTTPY